MRSSPQTAVGLWLLAVAVAVAVQVALGGITRLTDSGLSITEWKPLLGVIPPLGEAAWQEAFARYQQIPQFQQLKSHLTLDEFKFIYFWEWLHRLWGRSLGLFFVGPLVVFWRQGRLRGQLRPLLGLLALGGAQGLLGWVMVASGLKDLVYVSHLRLAAHFDLAVVLLVALLWLGLQRLDPRRSTPGPARAGARILLGALAVQLTWGAFMAGLKAALAAPTWPTINGLWVPPSLATAVWWSDPLAVHFVHRGLAYAIVAGAAAWWWRARDALGASRHAVALLALAQTALGVMTVLFGGVGDRLLVLGVAHQLTGLALVVAVVIAHHRLGSPEPRSGQPRDGRPAATRR